MKKDARYFDLAKEFIGKNILLTGATGFVGKVLLEKVLRTLQIGQIYVLLRDGSNLSYLSKYDKLMASEAFTNLRNYHGKYYEQWFRRHVIPIKADLTAARLNLSNSDYLKIRTEIDVYWHLAASVDFNAELKDNYLANVVGTLSLYEMAKLSPRSTRFIYISTAYVNANKSPGVILETITPSHHENPEAIAKSIMAGNGIDVADSGHPNTYTYTKALAEDLLFRRRARRAAVAIIRPSCICASYRDPFPGWIDSVSAASAPLVLVGYRVLAKMPGLDHNIGDIIPVDLVANSIILATMAAGQKSFQINHVASSHLNPITWGEHGRYTAPYLLKYPIVPLNKIPSFSMSPSNWRVLMEISLRYEYPKQILSCLQNFVGEKFAYKWILRLDKAAKSSRQVNDLFGHFTMNEWIFRTDGMHSLRNRLNSLDRCIFEVSPKPIVWSKYLEFHVKGISYHIRQLESRRRQRSKLGA